jgi:hypothetical protein
MIRGFIVSGPRILTVSSRFDILIDDQFARLDIRRSANRLVERLDEPVCGRLGL